MPVIDRNKNGVGKPWTCQRLHCAVLDVVREIRNAIAEGRLVKEDWDHNSPNYVPGRSNKQVKIAAAIIMQSTNIDMDTAWTVMLELAAGV